MPLTGQLGKLKGWPAVVFNSLAGLEASKHPSIYLARGPGEARGPEERPRGPEERPEARLPSFTVTRPGQSQSDRHMGTHL